MPRQPQRKTFRNLVRRASPTRTAVLPQKPPATADPATTPTQAAAIFSGSRRQQLQAQNAQRRNQQQIRTQRAQALLDVGINPRTGEQTARGPIVQGLDNRAAVHETIRELSIAHALGITPGERDDRVRAMIGTMQPQLAAAEEAGGRRDAAFFEAGGRRDAAIAAAGAARHTADQTLAGTLATADAHRDVGLAQASATQTAARFQRDASIGSVLAQGQLVQPDIGEVTESYETRRTGFVENDLPTFIEQNLDRTPREISELLRLEIQPLGDLAAERDFQSLLGQVIRQIAQRKRAGFEPAALGSTGI